MSTFLYYLSKYSVRLMFGLAFFMRTRGRRNIPKTGPVLVVGNHVSFFDPLLVGCDVPRRCGYMARSTFEPVFFVGWWMRHMGTVFVDRDAPSRETMQTIIGILKGGKVVVLFPEGTRSRTGQLRDFKRGLLLMVKKSGATVVPVGLRGTFEAFPPNRKFPRLFRPVSLHYGEPMSPEEVLADGGLELVRERVAALSGQNLASDAASEGPASDPSALRIPCSPEMEPGSDESGSRGVAPADGRSPTSASPAPPGPHST